MVFFALGLGVAIGLQFIFPAATRKPSSNVQPKTSTAKSLTPRWGQLEFSTLELERPDESFPTNVQPAQATAWLFDDVSGSQAKSLFQQAPLSDALRHDLLDSAHWQVRSNGLQVTPTTQVLRDMSPEARRMIYRVLAQNPWNIYHRNPFCLQPGEFEAWVAQCGLQPENQKAFRKLVFTDASRICFADHPYLESLCSETEKRRFGKSISEVHALLIKLRIEQNSDVTSLLDYWGKGSHGKQMKPLLESMSRAPGGASISISFFFPTFARMRLFTYPNANTANTVDDHQDCFWTAMNFFNEIPDSRFCNPANIQQALRTDYNPIQKDWQFGDVLMLVEPPNKALHMCVYVADDVVFTKNGAQDLQPWVLMRMPEMMKQYSTDQPVKIMAYRKKRDW